MNATTADCAALAETTVFLSYFREMPDHRQPGKVIYPLDEILLLCLLAVLAGAETFTDIARFGDGAALRDPRQGRRGQFLSADA